MNEKIDEVACRALLYKCLNELALQASLVNVRLMDGSHITSKHIQVVAQAHDKVQQLLCIKLKFWSEKAPPKIEELVDCLKLLLSKLQQEILRPLRHPPSERHRHPKLLKKLSEVAALIKKEAQIAAKKARLHFETEVMGIDKIMGPKLKPKVGKPVVFVGSAKEDIDAAREISAGLQDDCRVDVWEDCQLFESGKTTIEALEQAVAMYDFAIFVLGASDARKMRGKKAVVPRDNVIFELGLFIGKLGRNRVFLVMPVGVPVSLPTDLAGVTVPGYDPSSGNLRSALAIARNEIRKRIKDHIKNRP